MVRPPGRQARARASAWTVPAPTGSSPLLPTHAAAALPERPLVRDARAALMLLAQGLLKLYDKTARRGFVIRQGEDVPDEFQSAQCLLARLYVEEGHNDRAADLHGLMDRCRLRLCNPEWGLAAFASPSFDAHNVRLVDPQLRVPTTDCVEIARLPGGFGEDQVFENVLFSLLRSITQEYRARADEAYTALRTLVAQHSLITERALHEYLDEHDLLAARDRIVRNFYHDVPRYWLIDGLAHRCAHCATLMRPHHDRKRYPHGYCPIEQCFATHQPAVSERLDPQKTRLRVAEPRVLRYWTAAAIDELTIYKHAKAYGLTAALYPQSDSADVGIDAMAIGIDAKAYQSPALLARALNRGIGRLEVFVRRIVAVNDLCARDVPHYMEKLRDALEPEGRAAVAGVELMTVGQVLAELSRLGSEQHA